MPRSDRALINSANASKQKAKFWTDARVATLKDLWGKGEFSADIAYAIGDGCTGAMVVAKANRLKLTPRKSFRRYGAQRHKHIRVRRETRMSAQCEA